MVGNATTDFAVTPVRRVLPGGLHIRIHHGKHCGMESERPAAGSTTGIIAASQSGRVYTGLAIGSNAVATASTRPISLMKH